MRAVAVSLWLAIVALALAELWMIAVTIDRATPDQWGFRGFEAVLGLSFGALGALVAARRPDNRVGWLLLAVGLVSGFMGIADQYPVLADAAPGGLPLAALARWVSAWIWVLAAAGIGSLLLLYFPDGRLPSPRWRLAVALAVGAMATLIGSIIAVIRPIGTLSPSPMVAIVSERVTFLMAAGLILYVAAIAAAAGSLVGRYRRAHAEERQQIKWVAYAGVLIAVGAAGGTSPILLGQVLFTMIGVFFAVAIAIAVLRYRLYEIDVIINRTLVYGALSAVLAGVYTASITLSQRLFMAVTGERSDAAIVLTTLIVAATFTPLKGRLQAIVDSRVKPSGPGGTAAAMATTHASGPEALQLVGQLAQLHTTGAITAREFEAKKAELLLRV